MSRFTYGPINSRRYGISLGLDVVPKKTCSLDCIYCEVGKTTCKLVRRFSFYPLEEILAEIDDTLSKISKLDVVTFAGSGEPLLNLDFGKIVDHIKDNYPELKVVLLTNGTLLSDPVVRSEARKCDIVVPSLDGATEESFNQIDLPHKDLSLSKIIEGIRIFKTEFTGIMDLELFIVPGINDTDAEISAFIDAIKVIKPHGIQLNSLDRPGVVNWLVPATLNSLDYIRREFTSHGIENVQIVTRYKGEKNVTPLDDLRSFIFDCITRRPCTLDDFVEMSGRSADEVEAILDQLLAENLVQIKIQKRGDFYAPVSK